MNNQRRILVTGATGNVGRPLVTQLLAAGVPVRAMTRNPNTAALPQGTEVVYGDFADPAALHPLLEGVDAVFLVVRATPAAAMFPVIDRIAKHVRRIVFLSASTVRDGVERQEDPIAQMHADIERYITKSGAEWSLLRPGGFATNALGWWAPQIRAGDTVRWPYAAAAFPPIHERDIAGVAARVLTEEGHTGKTYVLTGPEALTQAEQVRTIGEAIGRPVHLEEVSPEEARQALMANVPPPVADMVLKNMAALLTTPAPVTDTVAEISGAPARTYRQWALDHVNDFTNRLYDAPPRPREERRHA